ncbi:MAG: hypothetical protein QHC88_07415 [Achromobacter sp.]|uniref:hypothetical protein n=1 Tax=Achromobacter sp. TaxID=134375 RepID=UPI0029AE9D74|nr:hypothetical protein [Achromobacter sp.]MDX3985072.1 hypothetical protein [Achromobacter sp.]
MKSTAVNIRLLVPGLVVTQLWILVGREALTGGQGSQSPKVKFTMGKMVPTLFQMGGAEMLFAAQLPDWLVACFRIALLGEIYPNIRAIAVGYHDSGFVLIRYYLHHQPTDFDLESLEVVATNLDALGGRKGYQKN